MESKNSIISTPISILLGCFMISVALLVNGGIIKIGKTAPSPAPSAPSAVAPAPIAPAPAPQPTSSKVSIVDAPVLGDKNAKVTILEFSDYECPFCKRHFDQTFPELKKNYIDTGKAKLVFRNYPLPFHEPMASVEANGALCAREQGGDVAYYKIHDEIFKKTTSNGNGLSKDQLWAIALEQGLNVDNFKACVEAEKYKATITKDTADGAAAGVSGTPSFFVGKSDPSGTFEGKILVGAQPYSAFQPVIDEALK